MRLRDWMHRTLRLVPPEFYEEIVAQGAARSMDSAGVWDRLDVIGRRLQHAESQFTAAMAGALDTLVASREFLNLRLAAIAGAQREDLATVFDRLHALDTRLALLADQGAVLTHRLEELSPQLSDLGLPAGKHGVELATGVTQLAEGMVSLRQWVGALEQRLTNLGVPAGKPVAHLDCGHDHWAYATHRDGTTQCSHCYEAAMAVQARPAP